MFSCKKKQQMETTDYGSEEVYTDSFSPALWENPNSAEKIEVSDMDIGRIIKDDILDPKLRKILTGVTGFCKDLLTNNKDDIRQILTPSAFNSFSLRFTELKLGSEDKYSIRVAYPQEFQEETGSVGSSSSVEGYQGHVKNQPSGNNEELTEYDRQPFRINFKILISGKKSLVSFVELTLVKDDYVISDFDEDLYAKLTDVIAK